ncbi:hypothetical protein QTO34_007900 [Cnephaeus nilssonii]|uniref:Uncharacterized protein n=1 Tax=Cnephaeus nilssonii TaxID=3371016 RepID=A0AA40I9B7_CNENI|nr:hypothetical protein QTO34_007900 [Eptesicus nilssonii]
MAQTRGFKGALHSTTERSDFPGVRHRVTRLMARLLRNSHGSASCICEDKLGELFLGKREITVAQASSSQPRVVFPSGAT